MLLAVSGKSRQVEHCRAGKKNILKKSLEP